VGTETHIFESCFIGRYGKRRRFEYWLLSPRLVGFWETYSGSRFFASSQMRSKLGLNVHDGRNSGLSVRLACLLFFDFD